MTYQNHREASARPLSGSACQTGVVFSPTRPSQNLQTTTRASPVATCPHSSQSTNLSSLRPSKSTPIRCRWTCRAWDFFGMDPASTSTLTTVSGGLDLSNLDRNHHRLPEPRGPNRTVRHESTQLDLEATTQRKTNSPPSTSPRSSICADGSVRTRAEIPERSGQRDRWGSRLPEADRGRYDGLAVWAASLKSAQDLPRRFQTAVGSDPNWWT